MSRVDALDVVVTSVGGKVGAGATAATSTNPKGEVNVSGVLTGAAQAVHSGVDLSTKGLQAVQGSAWAKGVPVVGSGLGFIGLAQAYSGKGPQSQADYAGVVSNGAAVLGGVALVFGAPVVATGLGIVAIGAGGYQIYQSVIDRNSPSSSLKNYNFGPNYRGYGFTDPRILDTSESYRSLNPTNSASINQTYQTSSSGGSGGAWNTSGGGTSGFGGSTVQPGSMTNTAPNQGPGYPTPTVTQSSGGSGGGGGGNSGFGGSKVQPGSATNTAPNQGPGWAPIVIDLDGDGVEIKPLSRSSTTFDADSDGYKERSAWAGADDGLLVIDLNDDGQVTQSKEIAFSEWTAEQDTDLQALAKVFDSNGDGTFDSRDAHFSEFRIWKDANSNGVADAGEMMTLQAAGIAANDIFYRRCANV